MLSLQAVRGLYGKAVAVGRKACGGLGQLRVIGREQVSCPDALALVNFPAFRGHAVEQRSHAEGNMRKIVPCTQGIDQVQNGVSGRDLVLGKDDMLHFGQYLIQSTGAQALLGRVAVRLGKVQVIGVRDVLPCGLHEIDRSRQRGSNGCTDGGRGLGKGDHQNRLTVRNGLPHLLTQCAEHAERGVRFDRDVLALCGIDQQIGAFCVVVAPCGAYQITHFKLHGFTP